MSTFYKCFECNTPAEIEKKIKGNTADIHTFYGDLVDVIVEITPLERAKYEKKENFEGIKTTTYEYKYFVCLFVEEIEEEL